MAVLGVPDGSTGIEPGSDIGRASALVAVLSL